MPTDELLTTADARYTIVRATVADLDAVIAIYEDAARWLTMRGIDQWRPGGYTVEWARGNIERDEVYLAWRDGAPVGKFTLMWADPEVWGEQPPDAGYVHGLAVRRSEAGRGLGVVMLRYAARRVAETGRHYLRLDCMANNQALRDYYMRAGFTHRGDKQYDDWASSLFERNVETQEIRQ